jgi:NAD(P)-dependent dehydrogenase (short-subunit alcohol dehydrogenase family)
LKVERSLKTPEVHTVLVTGGASGMGRSAALRLAADGKQVVVADLNLQAARETVEQIAEIGGRSRALQVDVAQEDSVNALYRSLETEPLDMLVHAAGILGETAFVEAADFEDWKRVLAVNLDGAFLCARGAVRMMQCGQGGRIALFSSVAGLQPSPGAAAYSTAKGGVISLARTLASEGARHNIRVNVIAPGYIETPMLNGLPEGFADHVRKKTPLKRLGEMDEVSALVAFLASAGADFFTGQVLSPNGGLVM